MKTLICIPVYNRFPISKICINQLINTCTKDCVVQIIDDGSTDPGADLFFQDISVIRQKHKGIDKTRVDQIKYFRDSEFDNLYLTDSDAFHDPEWYNIAVFLSEKHNLPVCLYRSSSGNHDFKAGITAPGISMFFTRPQIRPLLYHLDEIETECWDWQVCKHIRKWIYPVHSYVEHYGKDGIHWNKKKEDKAVNPTKWLQNYEIT
jgi:glycosyltransferase involved in cell wall biosynthesis